MGIFVPNDWREKVNHSSPKALKIRDAVKAIHSRGEYPGMRKVMRELGEEIEREGEGREIAPGITLARSDKWMSGRDNVVRKKMMSELGIKMEPDPFEGDYDPYWGYY